MPRPTVTEGTIIVRDDPNVDVSGLNRDIDRAREITRDEKQYVDAYISPGAIEEVLDRFKGIQNDVKAWADAVEAITQEKAETLPENIAKEITLSQDQLHEWLAQQNMTDEQKVDMQINYAAALDDMSNVEKAIQLYYFLENTSKEVLFSIVGNYYSTHGFLTAYTFDYDVDGPSFRGEGEYNLLTTQKAMEVITDAKGNLISAYQGAFSK